MAARKHLIIQTGWYWDAEFIGYFIADHLGYYEAAGLDVLFLEGGPNAEPERALLEGLADIAITVRETTIPMLERGEDLEIIGTQYKEDPLAVLASVSGNVARLDDLAGKTVAVPDISRTSLTQALSRSDVDLSTVTLIPYDGTATPLIDRSADAVVGYVTSLPVDLAQSGVEVRSFLLAPAFPPFAQNLIVARRSRDLETDAAVSAWLKASASGWRLNAGAPHTYPEILRETWFSRTRRSLQDEVLHNTRQLEFMGSPESYLSIENSFALNTATISTNL